MNQVRKILLIEDDRHQQRLMEEMVNNFRRKPFSLTVAVTYSDG